MIRWTQGKVRIIPGKDPQKGTRGRGAEIITELVRTKGQRGRCITIVIQRIDIGALGKQQLGNGHGSGTKQGYLPRWGEAGSQVEKMVKQGLALIGRNFSQMGLESIIEGLDLAYRNGMDQGDRRTNFTHGIIITSSGKIPTEKRIKLHELQHNDGKQRIHSLPKRPTIEVQYTQN